ncbi:MAG: hypothetical protein MUE73_02250 [Planctomycetes bacterium]|jgi:hypothetical protein|nr:hypothetical protein [Planctomycetota bacterium]
MVLRIGAAVLFALVLATLPVTDARPIPTDHPLAVATLAASGDRFQVIYVTGSKTDATSPDISTYHTFVQQDAAGAGVGDIVWHAMVATANQPIGPANAPQTTRVVLVNGTPFRDPGTLYTPAGQPGSPAVLDISGFLIDPGQRVWTGIDSFGDGGVTNPSAGALGLDNCYAGVAIEATNNTWWRANTLGNTAVLPIFALSEEVTVGNPADLRKGKFAVSRKKPSADSLTIQGTLPEGLPALPPAGIDGTFEAGGFRREFTLGPKGRSLKDPVLKVSIDQERRRFAVTVKKSDLAAALGLPDEDRPKPGTPVSLTWQITFEESWSVFGTSTFSWVSKQGSGGKGTLAP